MKEKLKEVGVVLAVVVIFLALIMSLATLIGQAVDEVEQEGLKNILAPLWYGGK